MYIVHEYGFNFLKNNIDYLQIDSRVTCGRLKTQNHLQLLDLKHLVVLRSGSKTFQLWTPKVTVAEAFALFRLLNIGIRLSK